MDDSKKITFRISIFVVVTAEQVTAAFMHFAHHKGSLYNLLMLLNFYGYAIFGGKVILQIVMIADSSC
ncbi:hypothetical protein [Bartonella sp. B39]